MVAAAIMCGSRGRTDCAVVVAAVVIVYGAGISGWWSGAVSCRVLSVLSMLWVVAITDQYF